jgi:sulfur carrier protein
MQIVVNGQPRSAAAPLALPALIEELKLADRRVAVELNGAIVPRSAWPATQLADGDRLEIVHAIGGG